MNDIEIWEDVIGYEGVYQVSSFGRVKSFWFGREKTLKAGVDGVGYYTVALYFNKKPKTKTVHRLVASTFLGISDLQVNHKDGNKLNNHISNLEYVTNRENQIHRRKSEKTSSKFTGVTWHKVKSKWLAGIILNGKRKHLGYFENEDDAGQAYLNALKENGIESKYA